LVYIDGAQHLEIGEFVTVKIVDSDEHDLWGELAV
jgi:ribosomal protein S12 methylthiotransferase